MGIGTFYVIIEYSKYGFGSLEHRFPTPQKAIDWAKNAQEIADKQGNPNDVSYEVVPSGTAIYSTFSTVQDLPDVA